MKRLRIADWGLRILLLGALPVSGLAAQALAPSTSPVVLDARAMQEPATRGRPLMVDVAHWGKWATLGATVGFHAGSTSEQRRATRLQNELRELCLNDPPACAAAPPDGPYLNPDTESLYDRGVAADRAARRYMLLGQLSLLTSVALFVIDLRHGDGADPDNVPFRGGYRSLEFRVRF